MKRTFCAVLAICLILCTCGCAKKEKPPITLDLEYFVRLGKIPECECVLGVSADELADIEEIKAQNERVCLVKNGAYYYYDKNDENKSVNYIVSFKGAYGFLPETPAEDITEELARGEMKAPVLPLEEGETFYAPPGEYTGIKYTYGVNTACFVFLQNRLYACTMY